MDLRLETKSYLRTKEPKTLVLHLKKKKKRKKKSVSFFFFLKEVCLQVFRQCTAASTELEVEAEYIQYFRISTGFAD